MNVNPIVHYAVLTLWILGTVMGWVCLVSLLWKRLAGKYFLLAVWLAADGTMSLCLLRTYFTLGFNAYAAGWRTFQSIELVLIAGVILEAYVLQSRHCRRFLWPGAIVASVFGAMSIAVIFCTIGLASDAIVHSLPMILLTRHFYAACFLFIRFSAWFFGLFFVKPRENVTWHVRILSGLYLCQALSWISYSLYNPAPGWAAFAPTGHFLNLCSVLGAYVFWFLKLTPNGEQWTEPPEMPAEEFNAQTREHQASDRVRVARSAKLRETLLQAWWPS